MDVRELKPRLWYWTAPHPEWTPDSAGENGWEQEVGCYAYVSADERAPALIDPLVPAEGEEEFWAALDGDVEHHGPPNVLLTCRWHYRSSDQILDRYEGARTWVYTPAVAETAKSTRVTDSFELDDPLPAGIEAHLTFGETQEVAYRIPEYGAIVTGDVLARAPGKDVRVWWADRERLQALLDRGVELLLLTHGEPVLEGGGDALRRALG
ncbi:MAG: hypothetical protein WD689_06760 [Gaiellaceae bacterium]